MRVVINAQLDPHTSGGIAQVLIGLAYGLGQLDGPEQYVFVCSKDSAAWLEPYIAKNTTIEINRRDKYLPATGMRESDGFWESYQPDVLHFPYQTYTRTGLPTVFNPHDLQHVHLPDLFTSAEYHRRELLYRQACEDAAAITVASRFVRDDIVKQYNIDERKTHIIPWAPPTAAYKPVNKVDVETVRLKYALPRSFMVYPASTWPHKNHLTLLDSLAAVRKKYKIDISLVCTGTKTEYYSTIARHIEKLRLQSCVKFVGRVPEDDLISLYRLADFMIVPTLFEAISFPVFEAFAAGLPVACSNVTALPEQVGDAAILFDPHDAKAISEAIYQLAHDASIRETLVTQGKKVLTSYSWLNTARKYLEVYRLVALRQQQKMDDYQSTKDCDVVGSIKGGFKE